MIKGSEDIKGKIKGFEGFVETPKRDNDGNYILGFGIQVDPKVKKRTTREEAERDFNSRIGMAESELSTAITRPLTQPQQDALIDAHYNMGLTKLRNHGIIDLVNQGKDAEVAALFKRLRKAEDIDTGKMVEMGNVPERADYRAQLWLQATGDLPSPQAQAQVQEAPAADIVSEIEKFQESPASDGPTNESIVSEISRFQESSPSPDAQFETATDISTPEMLEAKKKAQTLAKEFKIPEDVAEGMLLSDSEETVRTKLSSAEIKSKYPKTAEWASNPENNALLKKTKDYPKKIERSVVKLNQKKPDWQKAIDSNFVRLEDSTVLGQMIFGSVNKQDGIKQLRLLDEARAANSITSPEVEAVRTAVQRLGTTFAQEWDKLKNVSLGKDTTDNITSILKATYSAGQMTADEAAAFIITAAKHPEAYGQFMVEASGAPLAAGVIGSAAGSPVTGAASMYATSSLIAFGGKVREEMEKFRNPKTNEIDYEAFFSDPERIAKLRTEAVTYGLSIGAIETAFQFIGGKFISKALPKNPVMATAATMAASAAAEGVGEAGARTAGQIASGQDVTLKENMAEGVMEIASGAPMSAAGAATQGALNVVNVRKGTIKTADTVQEASKANEDVNSLSELKETLKTDPAAQEYPEQVAELIDTASTETVMEPATDEVILEPKADDVKRADLAIRQNAKSGSIAFTPSEWEAFNAARGMDPFQALEIFSPRTQAAYANARQADSSITIPISEWAIATEEDPDIDQIVRINGNNFNNLEANELIDAFEKNPLVFFDTTDQSDSAEENAAAADEPQYDQVVNADGSTIMRPIDLTSQFASREEQEAFEGFKRRFKRAVPSSIEPQLADDIAALQLRRFKLRAGIANLPVADVMNRLQFGRKKTEGKASATMPTFEKDFFTVAFNKNDKATSVIHELAHVWLHEMAEDFQMLKDMDLNTAHGDIKAYREAMDTTAEVLGLNSLDDILANEDDRKLERLHEIFAQTAEDYFMEGKSKNSRIARMMDRMREWLAKHVVALRKLMRKHPTLDITPKTEFIFDAILAATKASEDQVYSMFPEPMFTVSELGGAAAGYMSALYDARSEAIRETYAKSFTKGLRENDRIFETEYARISKLAEEEVDSTPSMLIRQQMLDVYTEYKKRGEKGSDPRISYESAQQFLTDGSEEAIAELKKNVPYFMMTGKKKGGITVPDFMNMVGINNADVLKQILLEANQREELIQEAITKKLDVEAAPLMKSEEEIHLAAEEAVNSEGREKIIKKEFEILMQMYPTQFVRATSGLINTPESLDKVTRDIYKAEASLQIGATPANKFSAENYLRDMNRLRRESSKAFKAKDFEKAISKKVQEARSYYLYRKALQAHKDLAKARIQLKNLEKVIRNNQAFKNTYDFDVVAFAVKTVSLVKSGQEVQPVTREDLTEESSLSETNIETINTLVSKLVGEPGGANLTVNGAVTLGAVAKTMLKIARDHKSLIIKDQAANLDEAVLEDLEKISTEVKILRDKNGKIQAVEAETDGNVIPFELANEVGLFAAAKTSNTKLRAALDQMYRSTEDFASSNLGRIFSWIGSQEAASDVWKANQRKKLREAMNKFPKGKMEKIVASDRYEWIPFIDKSDSPIFWDKANMKFESMSELIVAMLYMGSESGAKKFLFGKGLANKVNFGVVVNDFWTMIQEKFDKGVIAKEHLEFVNQAWEMLQEIHPQLKQVLYETEGFPMGEIKGWEVNTPIGKLKGGYFPVVHSKQISIDDFTRLLDGGSNLIDFTRAMPSKDTRMALERTEFYGDVNLNLNALNAYLEAASNVIHLRKPLIAFSKFIHHPAFMQAMTTRRPGMFENMIKPWMERVKLQHYTDPTSRMNGLNPLIKVVRQNTGISFFFGNIASVLRQTLGTFQALPEIGPRYMALSVSDFTLSPLTQFRKAIALSDVMKDRMYSSQTKFISVVEDLNRANDLISKGREGIEKVTYVPLQAAQTITDLIVWNAAYSKMIAKDKSSADAVAYADNVVKKSQGSSNISEMPNIQYGSEATKWFTQFSTVPLINYELVTEAQRRGEKSTLAKSWAISMALTIGVMSPIVIDSFIGSLNLFGEDDEEDKKDKDTLSEIIAKRGSGAVLESYSPIVGKYAGGMIAYGRPTLSPSARKMDDNTEKAYKGLKAWAENGTDLTPHQLRGVTELLTIIFGVPFALYGKMEVDNYNDLSQNEKRILKMDRSIQRRKAKFQQRE